TTPWPPPVRATVGSSTTRPQLILARRRCPSSRSSLLGAMRMLHPPDPDLPYADVFMVPSLSAVGSRLDVDLTTPDRLGTSLPLVVSHMNAVPRPRGGHDRPPRR